MGELYARRGRGKGPSRAKVEFAWAGTVDSTVVHLGGNPPADAAWRLMLDRVHRSRRPLVLWLDDEANLGAEARSELAAAVAEGSRVAVIAESEQNRGVATALRWLGAEAQHFSLRQLSQAASWLAVDAHRLHATLHGLDAAA